MIQGLGGPTGLISALEGGPRPKFSPGRGEKGHFRPIGPNLAFWGPPKAKFRPTGGPTGGLQGLIWACGGPPGPNLGLWGPP